MLVEHEHKPLVVDHNMTQASVSLHDRPLVYTSVGLSISVSSTWVTRNRFAERARRNGGSSTSATAHMDLAFSDEEHGLGARRWITTHEASTALCALSGFACAEPGLTAAPPSSPNLTARDDRGGYWSLLVTLNWRRKIAGPD